ncbi:MAG: hypothetical protein H6Q41_2908 [Deltaproteobacteria bacterium]|nr:hypothetical protein [Deltaproteobacteria bacterium]
MVRVSLERKLFSVFLTALVLFLIIPSLGLAQEEKKDTRPERGIAVYPEYTGVTVTKGETVKMDLTVDNKGRADETIDVKLLEIPKGWKATLRGGSYLVAGIFVPNGKSKTLALSLEPDTKVVDVGTYTFQITGQTADGKLTSASKLTVNVQLPTPGIQDITITTSYPVLRGQPDSQMEFSLDVANKSETDRTFNLSAVGPEKWEINYKPAYESKQISSLQIKAGQSQTVTVQVTPLKTAPAGQYPILVTVASGAKKADVKLTAILTGTYKIDAGTPTGILSLEAVAGKPANFSVFVKNTGSAVNRNVTFSSFKPENWEVTFKPEKIEALEPDQLKQVEVTVKPSAQALVGDYSVAVMVNGEKSDKTVEIRVTVRSSTAWGWIGIAVIIFVIAGLSALFIWLGRR